MVSSYSSSFLSSTITSTHASSSTSSPSTSPSASTSNRQRRPTQQQQYEVSSLGDPSSLASTTTDCYTTSNSSLLLDDARRRRTSNDKAGTAMVDRTKAKNALPQKASGASSVPSRTRRPTTAPSVLDLRDVRLTSRDTDQQTLIWNEMAANRRKLEEENQLLRDKLAEAQVANKVLRVKIKQRGGGGLKPTRLAPVIEPAAVRETTTSTTGLLRKVFSRKDNAFRNPVAPGIKRFTVASSASLSAPRGLPLPAVASTPKHVQHVLPLPDNNNNKPLQLTYYVTRPSSGRSTRTPPTEIVVPTSASASSTSPETVPESMSSSSPSNSPNSLSGSSPVLMRQSTPPPPPQPPRPPQPTRRIDPNRHPHYHQQQQRHQQPGQQGEQAYSLMRVMPLRRQETTETTVTVPHSNQMNSNSSSRRKKQPMSPGSAPQLPILMEDSGYGYDDDHDDRLGVSGCQPSPAMMMITTSDFPTSILERLAGTRIGPSSSFTHHHDPADGTTAAAIVLSACTPMWYDDEPEHHHYVHNPSPTPPIPPPPRTRSDRRGPIKYSSTSHEHY